LPSGPGARLFDLVLNSSLGIASGPLLNSKWVEAYAHLGFDILTYATVRSVASPAPALPNAVFVDYGEQAVVARTGASARESGTLAVSMGTPSMEPDVWRKDVRRAKDRLGHGQLLVVSVIGTTVPGGDLEALALDYARCAAWAEESGADAIEVHLVRPGIDHGHVLYDDLRASAHILSQVRAHVSRPIIARLAGFRSPRVLHEALTRLAPWVHGFALVHGIERQVVSANGRSVFDGKEREIASVVGADTYALCSRQVQEAIAWRKAGEWNRAIFAVGGITTVERARTSLRDGAEAVLVGTAAVVDPLVAFRFRGALHTAA